MDKLERLLFARRQEIDSLSVPAELEERLRGVLSRAAAGRRPAAAWRVRVAAAITAVLLLSYNFDTLAFYGRQFIGYDQVINGTLQRLNELGRGQPIGQSCTFAGGITVTLDGIMLDSNQLLLFYTARDPAGRLDRITVRPDPFLQGAFSQYTMQNGSGIIESGAEAKFVYSYSPPRFWEKRLRVKFVADGGDQPGAGTITFDLDRRQAMGYTLRQAIGRDITVDETTLRVEAISASPTRTVVTGSVQDIFSLAVDKLTGERFFPGPLRLQLLANGQEVTAQGAGISTSGRGVRFEAEFDALPENLQTLQLKLVSFGADHSVDATIPLQAGDANPPANILGQEIRFDRVYSENGDTYITFTTAASVVLTRVSLLRDGQDTALANTIEGERTKLADGRILHTRTMHFPGTGRDLRLHLRRLRYEKVYDQTIDIPLR